MSSSFRRVGDWAAGTVVIYSEARPRRRRRKRPARSSAHPPDLGQVARPVPIMLSADETSALLEFRRRRASWTSERAQEICDHLAPLTGSTGAEGLDTVLAYGRWLEEGR